MGSHDNGYRMAANANEEAPFPTLDLKYRFAL